VIVCVCVCGLGDEEPCLSSLFYHALLFATSWRMFPK
jgi:hypothetical protein